MQKSTQPYSVMVRDFVVSAKTFFFQVDGFQTARELHNRLQDIDDNRADLPELAIQEITEQIFEDFDITVIEPGMRISGNWEEVFSRYRPVNDHSVDIYTGYPAVDVTAASDYHAPRRLSLSVIKDGNGPYGIAITDTAGVIVASVAANKHGELEIISSELQEPGPILPTVYAQGDLCLYDDKNWLEFFSDTFLIEEGLVREDDMLLAAKEFEPEEGEIEYWHSQVRPPAINRPAETSPGLSL